MKQILLVAATIQEIQPTLGFLAETHNRLTDRHFRTARAEIRVLITGVGLTLTAYTLGQFFAHNQPDLAVNAGIAGALDRTLAIGSVVEVVAEEFADLGAEDRNGGFLDLFQLGLANPDQTPFSGGKLVHAPEWPGLPEGLPRVAGISVNRVHGAETSIRRLRARTDGKVESMEGAAFFYACLTAGVPFAAIRSVSNYVEPRNRSNWNIPLAVHNLNAVLIKLFQSN